MAKVFSSQTANANSPSVTMGPLTSVQQFNTIYFGGTFDTAILKLQASPDGETTWFNVPGASYIALTDGPVNFSIMATHLRLVLSSVGGSTDINAWIV